MFDIQGLLHHQKIHDNLSNRYSLVTYHRGLTLGTVIEVNIQRSEVSSPPAIKSQIFSIKTVMDIFEPITNFWREIFGIGNFIARGEFDTGP